MGRLCGGVNNHLRPHFPHAQEHTLAVPNIERVVLITGDLTLQVFQHPTGIAFGTKELRAMVAVDSPDCVALGSKIQRHLRPDQPT